MSEPSQKILDYLTDAVGTPSELQFYIKLVELLLNEQFKPDPQKLHESIKSYANVCGLGDTWIKAFSKVVEAICGVRPAPPPSPQPPPKPEMPRLTIGQIWKLPSGDKRIIVGNYDGSYSFTSNDAFIPFNCFGHLSYTDLQDYLKNNNATYLGMAKVVLPDSPAT